MQIFLYFCSVKTKLYIIFALFCLVSTTMAEERGGHILHRNELRIGWGDQMFETLMWHKPTYIVNNLPASYEQVYTENFKYYQHLWLEYQWRFNEWCSLGGMIDGSGVSWDEVTRNGQGVETFRDQPHYFYNIVAMPTVRFTYFHHPNVCLYSGLGLGFCVNSGSERNEKSQFTDYGAAFDLTLIGVSLNYGRWFCSMDLGGLFAMRNANTIFLAGSRIFNIGIGVRF